MQSSCPESWSFSALGVSPQSRVVPCRFALFTATQAGALAGGRSVSVSCPAWIASPARAGRGSQRRGGARDVGGSRVDHAAFRLAPLSRQASPVFLAGGRRLSAG